MKIDFDHEISEIIRGLKMADGYMACEKIIVDNIRKHFTLEIDEKSIDDFLGELSIHLRDRIKIQQNSDECRNYRYAEGFMNTLIKMAHWKSWIKSLDV